MTRSILENDKVKLLTLHLYQHTLTKIIKTEKGNIIRIKSYIMIVQTKIYIFIFFSLEIFFFKTFYFQIKVWAPPPEGNKEIYSGNLNPIPFMDSSLHVKTVRICGFKKRCDLNLKSCPFRTTMQWHVQLDQLTAVQLDQLTAV